jgi:[ribosomal protein S5]-alanine N-acetyltransferase
MRDGYLYSRLRDDPAPELGNGSVTGSGATPVEEPLAD